MDMKKLLALLASPLVGMSLLTGCAAEPAETEEEPEESSEAQTLTIEDPDYYTKFKGKGISINVYNWGCRSDRAISLALSISKGL